MPKTVAAESFTQRTTVERSRGQQQDQRRSQQADRVPAQRHLSLEAAPSQVSEANRSADQSRHYEGRHGRPEDVLKNSMWSRFTRKQARLSQSLWDKHQGHGYRVRQHQEAGDRMPDDPRSHAVRIGWRRSIDSLSHHRHFPKRTPSRGATASRSTTSLFSDDRVEMTTGANPKSKIVL